MPRPDVTHIVPLINSAKSVTISLRNNPHYDHVASGLALKLALELTGKNVSVVCDTPMTVEFNRLVGVESIKAMSKSRDLVIKFSSQSEHVEKINYLLDNQELHLVITPKPTSPNIDHSKLQFSTQTPKSDIFILIGIDDKDYADGSSEKIISITRDLPKDNFTNFQIYNPQASSISEIVTTSMESLSLSINQDIATNLLAGLEEATDFFRSENSSHETFEVVSHLLRRGARRRHLEQISASDYPSGAIPTDPQNVKDAFGTDHTENIDSSQPVPKSWYEPKVYKGPMLQ